MSSAFINIFILSAVFSAILTFFVRKIALKFKIVDLPEIGSRGSTPLTTRKIHKKSIPLLGGMAIFFVFFLILFIVFKSDFWPHKLVQMKHLIGLGLAGFILMLGGFLDDKYHLKPKQQIIWPILACLIIICSGIGINYINNPFGFAQGGPFGSGYLHFDQTKIEIIRIHGMPYYFTPWADLITFLWLMILMYATKLMDGLDGLVSGLTVIGGLVIAGLCFLTKFFLPEVGIMAMIFSGAALGFLFFNFNPAKIFLGEGGSLFCGFILGVLSIISGSKMATTFLVLGIGIIDLISVIIQRVFKERRSPFFGDKNHLHFRLLDLGWPQRKIVIFYWLVALIFGLIALFLRTKGKILTIIVLAVLIGGFIVSLIIKSDRSRTSP
ncbi:MAG: MraY family glycosyltransferase [Patescibacteria group bacterium]|nr:MraY family glycosyltransferase [Patescibacteria group bacterium]MDD5164322.1 MraY family glycosyltransferase [Patescibacteria group bacterium]MDD5534768.1 MraY family glycosyltransferase [Patescibacteria group bacterium]